MNLVLWAAAILFIFVGVSVLLFFGGMIVAMLLVPFVALAEHFWPSADKAARNEADKLMKAARNNGRASLDRGTQRTRPSHRPL